MEEYAFIDMHIHTEYSRKEPVRQTVKGLLDKLEAMAEEKGKPVAFSISDHESILGCIEANQLLKESPQKYKMLKFIPGVEFSTSLKCLGVDEDGLSIFKHCHILAYGYDVNNPELVNFSKIIYQRNTDLNNKGVYFQTGYAIVIAKKLLEKHFNKKIPFANLNDVIRPDLNHAQVFEIFVEMMSKYYSAEKQEIESVISEFFTKDKNVGDDILYNSKQSILDIIEMVHNAGGYICVAHANSIKYKKPERHETVDGKRHYAFVDLVNRVQSLTGGKGIDALELFHNENTDSKAFFRIQELAKKYNLYFTAGSDTHSPNINSNILSKCTSKTFEKATLPPNVKYQKGEANTNVVQLPFVDMCLSGKQAEDKQDFTLKNKYLGKMKKADADAIITKIVTRRKNTEATATLPTSPAPSPKTEEKVEADDKKYTNKKELKNSKQEYEPEDYYHAFSGSMKRYYEETRDR